MIEVRKRENFIGYPFVAEKDKDQGWIDADKLGTMKLKE